VSTSSLPSLVTVLQVLYSSMSCQPFAHVATPPALQELKDYETSRPSLLLADKENNPLVSLISWEDVHMHSVLGEGGFSFVFQVSVIQVQVQVQVPNHPERYALKCLKAKSIDNEDSFVQSAIDLASEADMLARMHHDHIIKLYGISKEPMSQSYQGTGMGYFLLLDIMQDTLQQRLDRWRGNGDGESTMEYNNIKCKPLTSKSDIVQRLQTVALPILKALSYLHSLEIVSRDLKPENVGFDANGTLKLFDFGLARHVQVCRQGDVAGSIVYMSPEVLLGVGTFLKSDVYSFGILCWELCTLEIPLLQFTTRDQVQRKVSKGGWRPNVNVIPSKALRMLIKQSWGSSPTDRPTMAQLHNELSQVCIKHVHKYLDK
jgi:serine/threonine protein kinase